MKPYLVKTPKLVQWIFPRRLWAFSRKTPTVYLTFDDGPIPVVTPWVLDMLRKHNANATFFCIGDNVRKHPEVFKKIVAEGHGYGNHTFHHQKGSEIDIKTYVEDITHCANEMQKHTRPNQDNNSTLFRPPYGKLTSRQAKEVIKKGCQIVMWDVLSADFDAEISEEKCLQNVLENIAPGSIVVFHDSLKAEKKLRYVLPKVLEFIDKKGWKCEAINS